LWPVSPGRRRVRIAVGLALAAAVAPGGAAHAQSDSTPSVPGANRLEEIVVTARRREENLQSTPVSVTAFTAASLEQRGI